MSLEREKQGLPLDDYKSKLNDGTYSLRIGKEVPEGDVNLAYIHTPKVQSDENISLIDTSYTSDNVIPQNQLESLVVANEQGELEYIDLVGNGEMRPRPPRNVFPSDKVNLTRTFKKNEISTENALYYKFEINYHYDSKPAIPDQNGNYPIEKYTGQQIEITDENGNLLDDTYKYDIYVQAQKENPRIYSVRIYMHFNTNEIETFKVRYNHIDKVVPDEYVQSVRNTIEFYTDKDNTISVDGKTKQMLESGKLRIINGTSAYEEKSEDKVRNADTTEEIFSVIPNPDGEGYRIVVPQRSESDPRTPRIFSYRIVAKYTSYDGQEIKVTVGHITDWCINPEALLDSEKVDYSGDWKNLGLPSGGGHLNAKDMIELSLPFTTPSIPSDAEYYIEDDKGNIMYHITNLTDNPQVDTKINEIMMKTPEARAVDMDEKPWTNAMQPNTVLKENPIPHRCSIIPERQITKWNFTWKADGQGYTEKRLDYKTNWRVYADVGFRKQLKPKVLDLLDRTKWSTIGSQSSVEKWRYGYSPEIGRNVIELLDNPMDVMGFYQRKEHIDGSIVDLMNKKDYQFSVKVRLTDPIDDDVIGLLFRVRDSQNYYMFAWEKDQLATEMKQYKEDHGDGIAGSWNGVGRIVFDEYGLGIRNLDTEGNQPENWRWTDDKNKYLNEWGFKNNHKRIFCATPSTKAPHPNPSDSSNEWDGKTRYPMDKTACSFKDITDFNATYNPKGWEYGKDYKITVVVTGDEFRIYISEDVDSDDLGELVCQAKDTTHKAGSYGIMCVSQRWTYWYDLEMSEIERQNVYTERKDILLTNTEERKISNYRAIDLLESLIQKKAQEEYGGAPYEIFGIYGDSDGDFTIRIDERTGFIYGKTNNPAAGGIVKREWKTSENGLTIEGTGSVEYHEDGHFTILVSPAKLPTELIPSDVLDFKWNAPVLTSGENVSIQLVEPDTIKVTATVPPITQIGTPYTLDEATILKSEEIKHMEYLFDFGDEKGFYEKLNIPEDIPKEEILLRIERGKVTGINADGSANVENAEFRVNYRFRCVNEKGFTRLPVDQFQDQLGVNRLRLKSIMNKDGEIDPNIVVDVVAWTTFRDLEAVPLFAIKMDDDRKIKLDKPKVEPEKMEVDNWYLRVKNGRFLKRIRLPYYEPTSGERMPQIYVSYPQLLGLVKNPDDVVEVDLEYSLPEYVDQEFYNDSIILVDKEKPVILNEHQIQTRFTPIVLKSETGRSYLEVYSMRGNKKKELRVSDVDTKKGIIYLHDRIREQDQVFVRYAYQEDWYTYRGFYKDDVEIIPVPQKYDARLNASLTIKAHGYKSENRRYYPLLNCFAIGGPKWFMKHMYIISGGIRGYFATSMEDYSKRHDIWSIVRFPVKFTGTTSTYLEPEAKNDIMIHLHEWKKSAFISPVRIRDQKAADDFNDLVRPLGVQYNLIDEYEYAGETFNKSGLKINKDHVLYKDLERELNRASCCFYGNHELVINGPHVTPLIWDPTGKHVLVATYENGDQLVFLSVGIRYYGSSATYVFTKHLLRAFGEYMMGGPPGWREGVVETTEDITFGPAEFTKNISFETEFMTETKNLAIVISPKAVFENKWDRFISKYKNHKLELTPILTYSIETNGTYEVFGGYQRDRLPVSERNMQIDDTFIVEASVTGTPKVETKLLGTDYFHLDLNPTPGHKHTIAKNGFHHWIPQDMDEEDFETYEADNKELLVKPIHVYMRPSAIYLVDRKNPETTGTLISGTKRDRVLFHTDEEFWFNPKDYKYDETMLRLGKVLVQANSNMRDNMTILDTRTRGGGLDESLTKDVIKAVNEESLYHWDIGYFDGEAYQENGVVVIRLPRRILKSASNPNGFTEAQVQEVVSRHKAFGVLPIVEFYDDLAKDEARHNILPNHEFLNQKHIGYYDPVRSSGECELIYTRIGSGDNHVLQLTDNAEYAITVPGYRFKGATRYRVDVKALKEHTASNRSAGVVEIYYKDGRSQTIRMPTINRSQWMVYKTFFTVDPNKIHHVTIKLNHADETRTGRVIVDYVMLIPEPVIDEETSEIHEI